MQTNKIKTVFLYSITHLLIDAACIFVLYSTVKFNNLESSILAFIIIVLYNTIAFGVQAFIGKIFDRNKEPKICAIIGCLLTISAVLFWRNPIITSILAGFGNAAFHVGGGIICLKLGDKQASIPGIYVAPGAMGLFMGAYIADKNLLPAYIFVILLSICTLFILINKPKIETNQNTKNQIYNKLLLIINMLLLAIIIRSFIGLSITLDWKTNISLAFLLTLAVVFGKMAGGIIADKLGWIKTTVSALIISSPLIAFGINNPILFITGIFFFNFTMPVTLTAISNMLNNREGFAFGLTTLALIIGAYPFFAGINLTAKNTLIIFFIVILSAALIYFGLKEYTKISKTK